MSGIAITHPKVASLLPEWRTFRGSSLLLRPLGRDNIESDVRGAGRFLAALANFMSPEEEAWLRGAGFCPLPPETFHVTWADLVHDGNLAKLDRSVQSDFSDGGKIAMGREYPPSLRMIVEESGVLDLASATFRLTASDLQIRNASALTVELAACSDPGHDRFDRARDALARLLAARLGLTLGPFRPHITLGYFADRAIAAAARPTVTALRERLGALPGADEARFRGPAPFRFSDMVTFVEC